MTEGRIPGRNEEPLAPVVAEYGLNLSGRILELGPGNGQLEPLVLAAGGEWVAVDKDPRAGARVMDYEESPWDLPGGVLSFDGIFCRNSIGAHWAVLPSLADEISVRCSGWAWLALWTGATMDVESSVAIFEQRGFRYRPEYVRPNQALVTL